MIKNSYDGQIEGQMTLDDMFEPPERMVAVSQKFARARKEMTLAEQKTFVYALSNWSRAKTPGARCLSGLPIFSSTKCQPNIWFCFLLSITQQVKLLL